jgi:NTE family protein
LEEHYLDLPSKPSTKSQGLTLPSWVKDYQGKMKAYFPEEKKKENQRSYSALELANRSFDLLQDRYAACERVDGRAIGGSPTDLELVGSRKRLRRHCRGAGRRVASCDAGDRRAHRTFR